MLTVSDPPPARDRGTRQCSAVTAWQLSNAARSTPLFAPDKAATWKSRSVLAGKFSVPSGSTSLCDVPACFYYKLRFWEAAFGEYLFFTRI